MAFWRRQPEEPKWPAAPAEGVNAFKKFYDAGTLMEVMAYLVPLIVPYIIPHTSLFHTLSSFLQSLEAWEEVCSAANLPQGGRYKEFFPILKAAYNVGLDDGD